MTEFFARRFAMLAGTMVAVSLLVFLVLEINVEDVAVKVLGQFSAPAQRHAWLPRTATSTPPALRPLAGAFRRGEWGTSTYYTPTCWR